MNVYDTKSLMGLLDQAGHVAVNHLEEAELVLLNTCAIREGAEQRVRGRVGQLKKYKDRGLLKYLGVCGCMGQKEGQRLLDQVAFLDLVMGPGAIGSIVRLVDELEKGNRPVLDLHGIEDDYDEVYPVSDEQEITYPRFLSIMKGCDKRCTYCIVPYTRGPERSRAPHILLQEAETLVQKGYKEITLIGQTVNSYHHGTVNFAQLLQMINEIDGLERIRFATSHPSSVTPEMLKAMASLDKVCEHLHLPFQSGSNRILERMERNYTREEYIRMIEHYRSLFDDPVTQSSVSTDVIVGFPGETEEDFEQTLDLMKRIRFDSAFMFKYSPRRGTAAAEMEDQIDDFTKARRLDRLIKLQQQMAQENNQRMVSQQAEVMLERENYDPKKGLVYETRLRTGRIVKIYDPSSFYKIGDILNVTITDSSSYSLYGIPTNDYENQTEADIA